MSAVGDWVDDEFDGDSTGEIGVGYHDAGGHVAVRIRAKIGIASWVGTAAQAREVAQMLIETAAIADGILGKSKADA